MGGLLKFSILTTPFEYFFRMTGRIEKKFFPDVIIHRVGSLSRPALSIVARLLIWIATSRVEKTRNSEAVYLYLQRSNDEKDFFINGSSFCHPRPFNGG